MKRKSVIFIYLFYNFSYIQNILWHEKTHRFKTKVFLLAMPTHKERNKKHHSAYLFLLRSVLENLPFEFKKCC